MEEFFFIVLFIWISFFPQPIQEKYSLFTKAFLIIGFATVVIRNRFAAFKAADWPLLAFLAAISVNIFYAQQKGVAFKTYLDLAIPLLCIYYIVSHSIDTADKFHFLAKIICIFSSIVAFFGLLDFLLGYNFIYEHLMPNPFYQYYKSTGVMRALSTQFHNPPLGSYLIASLPFSLLFMKESGLFFRLLGRINIVLCGIAIILTLSRGVLLGFIAMVLFILYSNKQRKLLLIFSAAFLLFLVLCAYIYNPLNRLGWKQLLFYGYSPVFSNYRALRLNMTIEMLKDHPCVGLGFQHFRILFYKYYPFKITVPYQFMIPDNMYLTFLAETGILGFIGLSVFILSVLRKAFERIKIFKYTTLKGQQLIVVLSAVIGLLINMGAYELFYWPNQYIYFCILIGLIEALCRTNPQAY